MSVGRNVAYWRKMRGLSRSALAKKAGTTHTHVGNIEEERSSPTVEMLTALAEALDVPVRVFFEENPGTISIDDSGYATVSITVPKDKVSVLHQMARLLISAHQSPLDAMSVAAAGAKAS